MAQPKVSIVIPIYNVEKFLDRCVEAVVGQTYKNIEIILVDDGSLDNCSAMCDEWEKRDERIKVIHKVNEGLGMARNTGIDNSTGKYVFFFDSDDYVDRTIVGKCVLNAEQNQSDVVIFGCLNAFENGKIEKIEINPSQLVFEKPQIENKLLPSMYTYEMGFGISAWGKMYRLESIQKSGIRFKSEREIISEDAFFALQYYPRVSKVSIVQENLYFYYKRNDSLSRGYKKARQEKNDDFIQKSLNYIDSEGLSENVRYHIIARYHMYTVAAIRQLMSAPISDDDRKKELMSILKSETLNKTVVFDVLKLHKFAVFALLILVKIKFYWGCRLLINLRK